MADELDSGSSGSLSCESSSLFFRIELQAPDTEKQRYSGVFHFLKIEAEAKEGANTI